MNKKLDLNIKIDKILGCDKVLWAKFHKETEIKTLSSNIKKWSKEWLEINFKAYPRLEKIDLGAAVKFKGELSNAILNRRSKRDFNNYKISKKELSNLLYFSVGIVNQKITNWNSTCRGYPSAGARYPLETYAAIINSSDLSQGLYHYNVKLHSLELLLKDNLKKVLFGCAGQKWIEKSSVIIFLTSVVGRSMIKYGDRAYRHSLLEAGHAGQNFYLVSSIIGLKCCAIGGFLDKEVNQLLDIDPRTEVALYILAVGK